MKPDSHFAREVAKQLERRRIRRRTLLLLLLLAAIILAVTRLTCGHGFGLGDFGLGDGEGSGAAPPTAPGDAGPRRCMIRVAASGLTVDGKPATRDQVIAACKPTTGAEVIVTGDAREGDWTDLKAALDAAQIPVLKRDPTPAPPSP